MAITCLAEFVNRSPEKAAQILPDLIENLSHYVLEGSVQLSHIARHMMRCILQQLKTNKLLSSKYKILETCSAHSLCSVELCPKSL